MVGQEKTLKRSCTNITVDSNFLNIPPERDADTMHTAAWKWQHKVSRRPVVK